jgi:UrcA family protein
MKTLAAITATVLVALSAGHAVAQTESPARIAVSYADLDLSKTNGRAVLERRVQMAVDRVCPERPLPTELAKQHTYRACRQAAWTGAKQQLASIYGGRQLAAAEVRVSGAPN